MSKRLGIVFILVLIVSILVFGQDKQDKQDKQLREEILAAYQSGGEKALLDFVKKNKDKITNKFIVDFAKAGMEERKEGWLKACKILAEEKKEKKTLADVLYQTGEYFNSISKNKKAVEYFDKALPIYQKLNDPLGQGNVYLKKGRIYVYTGDISKVLKMYEKALLFFEKANNLLGEGNVYYCKGNIYSSVGKNSIALEMYDKALHFYEKHGTTVGQGNVYLRKGRIYFYTGENSSAFEMYEKALPFFKKAKDLQGQGNIYLCMGDIYLRMGENSRALEMYDEALPIYKKIGNLLGQGNVYKGKGNIYFLTGDNKRTLQMYDKALLIFKKIGTLAGQGNVYLSKGDLYIRIGDNLKALEMYDKALPFYKKGGLPIGQGNVCLSKGDIYLIIGAKSKALEMYDKARPFFEKAEEPLGQGNSYCKKGEIYLSMGEISRALEMYDKALPFFEKVGYPLGLGCVYMGKGRIYFENGNNSSAFEMYDKALLFFEKVGETIDQGNVYMQKGDHYLRIGENSRALEMYDKALFFLKKGGHINPESMVLHRKARVFVKLGKKGEAIHLFEEGIAKLEKVRTQTAFSEMKQTFMENVYQDYQETVLFMLENKYYNKGFKYADSMRARVFLDRMAEGLVRLDKGLAPGLEEKRDKLTAKLSLLSKEMHQTAGEKEEKKILELKEQYRKIESEFEDLLVKIRLNNPLYASVRYPQPITVQALQKEVLKIGESLVRYVISPQKLYVFLVTRDSFNVIPLDIKGKDITGIVEHYLRAVKENDSILMKRYGKTLYERLFKPLEKKIKKITNIIIVPDRELATIPFESLILDSKGQDRPVFILEKYRIKYLQSASLLKILRQHYQNNRETKSFIGFGDPVYDYENFKQGLPEHGAPHPAKGDEIKEIHRGNYDREGGKMARLKGSGKEVNTIAELFKKQGSENCVVHMREKATEENAKSPNLKEFNYIHFSCHGILGDTFQSLVLSQLPPDKSKEDGYFTLNEIMNCDYNAKLVVLSACQTGTGKLERAEGVTGLTRAVMYAGTPAVIASLWKVDDTATKKLMIRFYKNMLEKNMDKTEALRQAKLEMLKSPEYSSPLFWSAFVLYGE